jgi:hypothetical protein
VDEHLIGRSANTTGTSSSNLRSQGFELKLLALFQQPKASAYDLTGIVEATALRLLPDEGLEVIA